MAVGCECSWMDGVARCFVVVWKDLLCRIGSWSSFFLILFLAFWWCSFGMYVYQGVVIYDRYCWIIHHFMEKMGGWMIDGLFKYVKR